MIVYVQIRSVRIVQVQVWVVMNCQNCYRSFIELLGLGFDEFMQNCLGLGLGVGFDDSLGLGLSFDFMILWHCCLV